MKRSTLIIIGIIVIILGGLGWKMYSKSSVNIVKSFVVEEGSFVATTQNASKVEVMGVPEGMKMGKDNVNLGTMELVEKNDAGEQTWILATPAEKSSLIEVYAVAYNGEGKQSGTMSLPEKGTEALAQVIWPAPSEMVIYGLVREISGNTLRLSNGGPRAQDIVVTLPENVKILDLKGKAIARSRLTKNTKISVSGNFTDELAFAATYIELANF
jgi:hypothetical protein